MGESKHTKISILLEEYRALYQLVLFRMGSLDRRAPVATATLSAFLASIAVLPPAAQMVLLVGLPLSVVWLVRTTINHARSFEDALRRIEEIEVAVNTLSKAELLRFQSSHPSRGWTVGGRTARETINAVITGAVVLLGACLYLFLMLEDRAGIDGLYPALIALVAGHLFVRAVTLSGYRYSAGALPPRP